MPKIKPIVARTPESLARTLGLSKAEAQEWRFQHELLSRLKVVVKREAVTHADLAKRAATSRTRVTAILNGDLEHVSSDLLIRLLTALGYRVRAVVSRTAACSRNKGSTRVFLSGAFSISITGSIARKRLTISPNNRGEVIRLASSVV